MSGLMSWLWRFTRHSTRTRAGTCCGRGLDLSWPMSSMETGLDIMSSASVGWPAEVEAPTAAQHEIQPFTTARGEGVPGRRRRRPAGGALHRGADDGPGPGRGAGAALGRGRPGGRHAGLRTQLQRFDGRLADVPLKTDKSKCTLTCRPPWSPACASTASARPLRASSPPATSAPRARGPLQARTVPRWFDALLEGRHPPRPVPRPPPLDSDDAAGTRHRAPGSSWASSATAQLSTTTDRYQHVVPELQREAAARLDALLGG